MLFIHLYLNAGMSVFTAVWLQYFNWHCHMTSDILSVISQLTFPCPEKHPGKTADLRTCWSGRMTVAHRSSTGITTGGRPKPRLCLPPFPFTHHSHTQLPERSHNIQNNVPLPSWLCECSYCWRDFPWGSPMSCHFTELYIGPLDSHPGLWRWAHILYMQDCGSHTIGNVDSETWDRGYWRMKQGHSFYMGSFEAQTWFKREDSRELVIRYQLQARLTNVSNW